MRFGILLGVSVVAIAILVGVSFVTRARADEGKRSELKGSTVVVELFTSEGCSSCPPADRLLAELAAKYEKAGQPVFFLAYHVDYWDHLGWKDPFGDAASSERQGSYSASLKENGVYTPQMIVNGRNAFVGSDRAKATAAIDKALAGAGDSVLTLDVSATDGNRLQVKFSLREAAKGSDISVAIVQHEAASSVARGENQGSKLKHHNVVRRLVTVPLTEKPEGVVELSLPAGIDRKNLGVIAFVQRPGLMQIVAAAEAAVPDAPATK